VLFFLPQTHLVAGEDESSSSTNGEIFVLQENRPVRHTRPHGRPPLVWKRCSTCKKEIAFTSVHRVCNVSTCNRTRTALAFYSVACWDAHVPMLRHREAWAEERRAPTRADWERQLRAAEAKERRRSVPARRAQALRSDPASRRVATVGLDGTRDVAEPAADPAGALATEEVQKRVRRAVGALPEPERCLCNPIGSTCLGTYPVCDGSCPSSQTCGQFLPGLCMCN
jgi:hypothetical protein